VDAIKKAVAEQLLTVQLSHATQDCAHPPQLATSVVRSAHIEPEGAVQTVNPGWQLHAPVVQDPKGPQESQQCPQLSESVWRLAQTA
jgi:hypothetical protein